MRFVVGTLVSIFFAGLIWFAGRAGYSRVLAEQAINSTRLDLADRAVEYAPLDPEAHLARGVVLWSLEDYAGSYKEYERAVALKPRDYYLWFRLGYAHYLASDEAGAIEPFRESARLAPYYNQPHWMLGTLLLNAGQQAEAFAELRLAARSNPVFFPDLISLAWDAYGGDVQTVMQVVEPQSPSEYFELALFFVTRGKITEAMSLLHSKVGRLSASDQNELVIELLSAGAFDEAHQVWADGREAGDASDGLIDGSFEGNIDLHNEAFGWQVMGGNQKGVSIYLDPRQARAGKRSLRLDFNEYTESTSPLVSQIVLVQPNASYRLTFAARTQDMLALNSPIVTVADAAHSEQTLAQSPPLSERTSEWKEYTASFVTSGSTRAVLITFHFRPCDNAPCPIFGHVWLDNFSLEKQ